MLLGAAEATRTCTVFGSGEGMAKTLAAVPCDNESAGGRTCAGMVPDASTNGSARPAIGSQGRKESRIHVTITTVCDESDGNSAADELGRLDLVEVLLVVNSGRDLLRHLIGGASANWVEFAGGLRIKHVVHVANCDLRLLSGACRSPSWNFGPKLPDQRQIG
jgi:hypothetical protein